MSGMKVGRDTSFQDIYDTFKRSSSMGSSKHLRFSKGKGLYTHSSWRLSGWGGDALAKREGKWQDAAGQVKTALARQYGDRFADELFQSLDLAKGVTGLDLERIKRATARFEDATLQGKTDDNVRFNRALGQLDKIDPQIRTQEYKAEIKVILRDFTRRQSPNALRLSNNGVREQLSAITDDNVDRMSVEELKALRDEALALAHKETKGQLDSFQARTHYWTARHPDFETMFENTGITNRARGIDYDNPNQSVRNASPPNVGLDRDPIGSDGKDKISLLDEPSAKNTDDDLLSVKDDEAIHLKKSDLGNILPNQASKDVENRDLVDDGVDNNLQLSGHGLKQSHQLRNDSIGDISDTDSDDDPDRIGADFNDDGFPAISDAVDLGYVNCFNEKEMDKLKNELLDRAGKYRYPPLSVTDRHQARQFIQKTLEDWNWMAPKERDSNAQKMRDIPELHEVLEDMVQVISAAGSNVKQDKLNKEMANTDDKRFVLLAKGTDNYKKNVLHELQDDKRDIVGDPTVVEYFKKFTKLNSGKGDLTNDQADDVLRLAFNLNQHLKTTKNKVTHGPSTLSELNRGLGRVEKRFNPKLEENFGNWLDDRLTNDWPNHCGKEELQVLLRIMGQAVKINE